VSEHAFTPGPWQFSGRNWRGEEDEHGHLYVTGNHGPAWDTDEDGNDVEAGESCTGVARVEGNPTSGPVTLANARLIAAAPAHAVLLSAMVRGLARWEAFPGGDGRKGEVCVGGLRYATELDETGCPVIQPHLYRVLARAEGR
jgi:hypothetical protein